MQSPPRNRKAHDVRGSAVCNELLIAEMGAVEVYTLASRLLGCEAGPLDYDLFRAVHEEQAADLRYRIRALGGRPREAELSWDRPLSAVLSAATIYGADSPLAALLAQEHEIVAGYAKAAEDPHLTPDLRRWIEEGPLHRAGVLVRQLELYEKNLRIEVEDAPRSIARNQFEANDSQGAVA